MVFQLYLDDSNTNPSDRIISMGGLVARADGWANLEPRLEEMMNRYGVPILHTKDFHNTDRTFKGWKIIKKVSFANEIAGLVNGTVTQGICYSARNRTFKMRKTENPKFENMSAFAVCFSALLVRLLNGCSCSNEIAKHGLSIFLEGGNKNNGNVLSFFDKKASHSFFRGALRDITIVPKERCRAIQLADFFTFYARKHADNVDRFDGKLSIPIGRYFEPLERSIPIISHTITDPFEGESSHPISDFPFVTEGGGL